MLKKILAPLLLLFLFPLTALAAPGDVLGQDHPLVPRLPGWHIREYYVHDFDVFDDKLPRQGQPDLKFHAEGKITYIRYTSDKEIMPMEMLANYATALKAIGAVPLNESDSVFGNRVFKLARENGDIYVAVRPEGNHAHYYNLTFIEPAIRQQLISADAMYETLNKVGFLAFYVNFDTNKSDIKLDGEPVIAQIVSLLKAKPDLKIYIDGHTDNVGSPAANKALSQERAKAVLQAVVRQGIDASRLTARGFGQEVPIADNRLDDGRAKNRRVELVRR
jgi:outer membrane protein OmpA-like peptidoglycan-associated protein